MKRLVSLFLLFFCIIANAQLPQEIKHVEILSEVADTMVVINKTDVDKINTAFYLLDYADSLNSLNEQIINTLKSSVTTLESICENQKLVISNQETQINNIKSTNKDVISDLEKQLKIANRKKTF